MPCLHTRGFISLIHRADHFKIHGARLGIATEEEYETFADNLLRHPCPPSAHEFIRSWNRDLVRYDEVEDVFAVKRADGFIKTCFRPDPSVHLEATNLDYYLSGENRR